MLKLHVVTLNSVQIAIGDLSFSLLFINKHEKQKYIALVYLIIYKKFFKCKTCIWTQNKTFVMHKILLCLHPQTYQWFQMKATKCTKLYSKPTH